MPTMKLRAVTSLCLLASFLAISAAQEYTCSASQQCEIGCCSSSGYCGFGPDFCGETCLSTCDRKSECDPGWGTEWSAADKCPLNVCCSEFGFCGTTEEFCGDTEVKAPSCSGGSSSSKRTIGYYEAWNVARGCDRMYPESIPLGAYTHLNFAFAFIDPDSFEVAPMSSDDVALYSRFTGLKSVYPNLETWIAIGGWSMNDPNQPTATTFSDLAASESAQSQFFESLLSFLETYGFDGVDLDWEYPVAEQRSGKKEDYDNLTSFLKNLRNALASSGHNYGLTITIPASYWYLQHFDIVKIEKSIDWFNIMSYDLHGTWDATNEFLGPYVGAHTNLTEIDGALDLLWRNDIDPEHVVLGLGFYGRSFTLANPSCSTPGCVFSSGGNPGPCTASAGTLSYSEIRKVINDGANVELDSDAAVKMVTWGGNQWVSYDDEETLGMKVDYANNRCLGGTMVWAVSTDDAQGSAAAALANLSGRSIIAMSSHSGTDDQVQSCRLGECGESCSDGLSPAQRSDGNDKGNTGTNTGCKGDESRLYCCPPDNMPTCRWRGTAPFCDGKCHDGEVEVSSSLSGTGHDCWTGHKVLCCTQNAATEAVSHCRWTGSAPFCAAPLSKADCPDGRERLTYSNYGAGGEQPCITGYKSFCCDQPPPYEGCDWYYHGDRILFEVPFQCTGDCPAGKASIATDPSGCFSGYGSFCCDSPPTTNDPLVSAFRTRLEQYASNPGCEKGEREYSKRDGPSGMLSLSKRHDLKTEDWISLMGQLTVLAVGVGRTYQTGLMEDAYKSVYGDEFGLQLQEMTEFQSSWPNMEPVSIVESLMCMGRNADDVVGDYEQARSELCEDPCAESGLRRRHLLSTSFIPEDTNGTKSTHKSPVARNIGDSEEPLSSNENGEPTWGYIVEGIIDGLMTLEYEQLILTNRGENILEIVWQLPSDPNYRGIADDRYAVFHFHFEHLADLDGVMRPGIYAVVAFHGQEYGTGRTPRVDGNDNNGDNRRARIMRCNTGDNPTERTIYWYPGNLPNDAVAELPLWARMLTRFGNYLFDEDLATEQTFTGNTRGQLRAVPDPSDPCPRLYFEWDDYTRSRQFTPDGGTTGQPNNQNQQNDNDGV